jgi:O-antigen biosynthesis protein
VEVSAVVPTLGRSALLVPCLEALRREGAGGGLEVVVVDQGARPAALPPSLADQVVRPGGNLGFAGGTNRGIAASSGKLVALVNDDALVDPGWLPALRDAMAAHPRAAAAQGVNLQLDRPEITDGRGLGWNRSWQAVQLGVGEPAPAAGVAAGEIEEVFGVSATAALFRRDALLATALPGGQVFDARLGSYYEDVDLACRLRAAGLVALSVPAARARHAGSVTGRTLGSARWAAIYGNRHLVLARHLGATYWRSLPRLLGRDARDLARAVLTRDGSRLAGIARGWARAARHLPAYARRGAPSVPLPDFLRFRITSPR